MKPSVTKHTLKEITELLESDDELPDSYDEVPEIPAYQNDNRFERLEPIEFEWLHQKLDDVSTKAEITKHPSYIQTSEAGSFSTTDRFAKKQGFLKDSCTRNNFFTKQSVEIKKSNKILISKGILSKRDIFFIKSIEEYSTDTTLLWFIDFLNYKAVQPLQRSCLVGDMVGQCNNTIEPLSDFNMRYYLKLVMNK